MEEGAVGGGAGAGQMAPSGGAGTAADFSSAWLIAPRGEQPPFLFGCCSVGELSRPAGRLGLEMPCLQPAIVAVAGESTLCALQASRRDILIRVAVAGYAPPASPVKCWEFRLESPETAGAPPRPRTVTVAAAARARTC